MNKLFKKTIALVLCLVMLCGFSGIGASAATYQNPVFSVTVLEETDSIVRISLNLVSGQFNCLDFSFKAVAGYELIGIIKGSALSVYDDTCLAGNIEPSMGQHNIRNGAVSIICSSLYSTPGSFYVATYNKANATTSKNGDFNVDFSNCSVLENGTTIVLSPSTQFDTTLVLDAENLSMNYKDSAKITCVTNASTANTIKWYSTNEDVATVDEFGNVYASGKGNAEIICEVVSPTNEILASAKCNVEVKYTVVQWIIIIVLFGFLWYI